MSCPWSTANQQSLIPALPRGSVTVIHHLSTFSLLTLELSVSSAELLLLEQSLPVPTVTVGI